MKTIVTKGEFAAMKGRGPSAVSNWIADGKISPAALVGTGVRARIWVEQAERDLARNLDPSQQIAQDHPVSLTAPAAEGDAVPAPMAGSAPAQAEDEDLRRRRKADADAAEHQAQMARLKVERESGRWVDAAEVSKVFAREMAKLVSETEAWATQKVARTLADAHGLEWRTLSVEIRTLWREFRTGAAEAAVAGEGRDGGDAEQS